MRAIQPDDQPELRRWFATVSPESRYARFLRSVTDLSPQQWTYLTHVDGHDHVAYVACRDGQIAGVARWIRDREDPELAEVAFLIGDNVQRRGIGTLLCTRLIEAARIHGVRRFRAYVLPQNVGIRRLLAGSAFDRLSDTGRIVEVALREPDSDRRARSVASAARLEARAG